MRRTRTTLARWLLVTPLLLPGASPAQQSAGDAARDVCAGKVTSEKLVAAALARAKETSALNAFITLDERGALAAARRVDAAQQMSDKKRACGPLAGVPIVVKDNIHVAGLPNSAGTPALKGFVPKADAPVVQRLRAAGAIVLGKTNMHELAFGISGYNAAFKTGPEVGVRNAYDATQGRRRLVVGHRRGARRAGGRGGPGHRHRRLGAHSLRIQRLRRAAPDGRPLFAAAASRRSRTPATPPGRWRWRWPTSSCSTASSPARPGSRPPT